MPQQLFYLNDDPSWFPDPNGALDDPSGLLAIGGDLTSERVHQAYLNGVFPWYSDDEPIMWWSPDPRAIFYPEQIKVNKSLRKFLKKCQYSVSINTDFKRVMEHCAKPRPNSEGTWIMPEMIDCYSQLHREGHAHSIEIWQIDENGKDLIGGLYGVLVGNCFCGESMFSKQKNASKLALICLAELLKTSEGSFIDCQLPNPYLMSMGAKLISREVYLSKLLSAKIKSTQDSLFSPRFIQWQTILKHNDNG
ncbi:MAG: leucyl/phenylalanyl-tRNA--protein transferase [Gammaproteobacteria bacterium]|nr:leucyl/phenylalanyl-tRNA--protein transferase [Gammaproteobacteria bacterium]